MRLNRSNWQSQAKLHADKTYNSTENRWALRRRGVTLRIARQEPSLWNAWGVTASRAHAYLLEWSRAALSAYL
jgi:hypothetical protein